MSDDATAPSPDAEGHDADIAAVARHHGADPDALLREVSAFRVALDADLTVAAAAREAAPIAAADPDVHAFEEQLLARVERDRRSADVPRFPAQSRRIAAATAVATLVVLGGGAAYAATAGGHGTSARPAAPAGTSVATSLIALPSEAVASSQVDALDDAVAGRDPATIGAAASALHSTVAGLVGLAGSDPALASRLWVLVEQEQATLASLGSHDPAIVAALSAAQALLVRLAPDVARAATSTPVTLGTVPVATVATVAAPAPTLVAPAVPPPATVPAPSSAGPSTGEPPPSLLVLPSPAPGARSTPR